MPGAYVHASGIGPSYLQLLHCLAVIRKPLMVDSEVFLVYPMFRTFLGDILVIAEFYSRDYLFYSGYTFFSG